MVIVAILSVRRAELASFRRFESAAAQIMREHAGELERSVVVDTGQADQLQEVHVIRFADGASFEAYRASPKLAEIRPLRDVSVIETELFIGEDGPDYRSAP